MSSGYRNSINMMRSVIKSHLSVPFFKNHHLTVPVGVFRCCYQAQFLPCTRFLPFPPRPPRPVLQVYLCAVRSPSGCLHVIKQRKQILYRYYIYIDMFFHWEMRIGIHIPLIHILKDNTHITERPTLIYTLTLTHTCTSIHTYINIRYCEQ